MKEIINSEYNPSDYNVAIIDFWADWCMPCKIMLPIFTKLSKEFTDITFLKANVEENTELAKSLNINSIPTLVIFKQGKIFSTLTGLQQENKIREALVLASQ